MLLRSAWLLTGNWTSAEDLVQTALCSHGCTGRRSGPTRPSSMFVES